MSERGRDYNGGGRSAGFWRYFDGEPAPHPRWLIKGILPESGTALVSGQWGTFKTTTVLDLCLCAMSGRLFAGRYRIKRRGAVLFFALEGAARISARLSAIAGAHKIDGPLPFAWGGGCPPLTNDDAVEALRALVDQATAELRKKFGTPTVLIVIDTLISAAQYKEGGDNDTAAAQKVMSTLAGLSESTGALVVGVDHFGKVVETGTRGSSAKEGAADVVLVLLADRELGGGVKNTRLAVRKQRDGISGFEIPFTVRTVETGEDEDGDPLTAQVIDWQEPQQTSPSSQEARWTPSMQTLRRLLMTALLDHGQSVRPFPDGPQVRACDAELIRAEFYRQYPADGTNKQKSAARRKAFSRSLSDGVARSLVATREVDGVQFVWLVKSEEATAKDEATAGDGGKS